MSDHERLMTKLRSNASKVPSGINTASIQKVRTYKDWLTSANKAIKANSRNEQLLASLNNQYETFK
jgi:hypothetical protein